MKFDKIKYIELQMSGDEFDILMNLLENICGMSGNTMKPEHLQREASTLRQKISNAMHGKGD